MKLVIAETGIPPLGLGEEYGRYPAMMQRMLEDVGYRPEVTSALVSDGEPLPDPDEGAGLLVTGSPAGAYEDHAWIASLEASIRDWVGAGAPVVGICFGHQIMAQALGGKVISSEKGWGVGVHTYELFGDVGVPDMPPRLACVVSHRDQVVELPEGSRRLGGSPFCPNGIIRYAGGRAISFQMHPEFRHDFAEALLRCRYDDIPEDRAEMALASFPNPTDRERIAEWMGRFFEGEAV